MSIYNPNSDSDDPGQGDGQSNDAGLVDGQSNAQGQGDSQQGQSQGNYNDFMAKKHFKSPEELASAYQSLEKFQRQTASDNQSLTQQVADINDRLDTMKDDDVDDFDYETSWADNPQEVIKRATSEAVQPFLNELKPLQDEIARSQQDRRTQEVSDKYGDLFQAFRQNPQYDQIVSAAGGNVEAALIWHSGQNYVDNLSRATQEGVQQGQQLENDKANAQMLSGNSGANPLNDNQPQTDFGDDLLNAADRRFRGGEDS